MKKKTKLLLAFITCLVVIGCGSVFESEPIGIGKDPAEMKISPCACILIKQPSGLPEWFIEQANLNSNIRG